MKALKKLIGYDSLVSFFLMELLGLTAFMLGNGNIVFAFIGIVLSIFGGLILVGRFSKNELPSFLMLVVPIFAISIFVSFSTFAQSYSILANIANFLGINAYFLLGMSVRRFRKPNVTRLLVCVYAGFALVTLISLFYTLINYGLFYSLRYKETPIYYYNGELFNITQEQGWLNGLGFSEVTLNYTGLFGVILSTALVALLFLKPKENKIEFVLFSVFGGIGILSLLVIPNLFALLYLIPIAFVALIIKVLTTDKISDEKKKLIRKILFYVFVVAVMLVLLYFIVALLNASGYNQNSGYVSANEPVSSLAQTIKNNWFLNKLFNNGLIMGPINVVLNQSGIEFNLFGFKNDEIMYPTTYKAITTSTHMFEIELIKEGGIFAFIVLFALIVIVSQNITRYFDKSKDSNATKALLISLIFVIFLYSSFSFESFPIVHSGGEYNSFFRSLPTYIFLFLIGLVYYPSLKKGQTPAFEVEVVEEVKEESSKDVEDDYSFTIEEEDNHEENI